uniref:Uncharacterized protein n=2 Tax=Octactis speculum TaxID=3111310 RepID=A0A7S2D1H5_9STRA|mmetsp:Transcript_42425/g.57956  ORF Transcript_42425/g.57956 Transcript_42425/m.57956 type:complete len:137 (+) Transcript_42425:218-628(+)
MDELHNGDAIIVTHPASLIDETRIITMVLSNVSMNMSSAFSSDLISTSDFRFVNQPREEVDHTIAESRKRQKRVDGEKDAFGTYAGDLGEKFVYRERKPGVYGGYYICSEDNGEAPKSRGELLNMRSKKKADRMCM